METQNQSLQEAILQRRSCRSFLAQAISFEALQRLLWAGQGRTDDSGNLTAPSADALHPLRLRVAVGNVERLNPGLFEFEASNGMLNPIHKNDVRTDLERCAIGDQPWVREAACVISVCADFVSPAHEFADQPPFGERGSRYVTIEAGASAQNVALQATAEGIGCVLVAGFRDEAAAHVLELQAPYRPVLHLCLGVPSRQ